LEKGESISDELRPSLAAELFDKLALEEKARRLIHEREAIEHDQWEQEPEINARTAIFEELTAKGHLSKVEFDEPPELTNERTLRRLVNGWSDSLPEWEMKRRFHEIVEELTIHETWRRIQDGELPADTIVVTISDFPEMCDDNLAPRIGYRALNKKGMVRVTDFENGVRTVEQVSRSQSNDGSSERFFGNQGFVVGSGSDRVLSNQLIATKRHFVDGVVDVQRALDSLAGPNVLYGERDNQDPMLPTYEELRQGSADRENQAQNFIKKLADFERELNFAYKSGRITYQEKMLAINNRREELVNEIIILRPSYAKDARGEVAAEHFEQASLAMAAGNDAAGVAYLEKAIATSDPNAGVVCGGSGESIQSTESGRAKAERLYKEAKEERKNWKWSKGLCVVKECPTRPAKTDVGPCEVCRKCQNLFDAGRDPRRVYSPGIFELLFGT